MKPSLWECVIELESYNFFSLLINVVHTMFCASQPHTVIKYLLFSYCDFILDILYTCITMHVTGCCKTYPTKEEMQNCMKDDNLNEFKCEHCLARFILQIAQKKTSGIVCIKSDYQR